MPVTGSDDDPPTDVTTWHYGLIAKWWANFNVDGPEIEFFGRFVADHQPGLDVGCGTGRLLVPWVVDGLDVDGVDVSADMIDACREAAGRAGCEPTLFVQPTHLLDLPRRYGTVVMCGSFGLGVTRQDDLDGLRRVFEHLRPGGMLVLDDEVGVVDDERWNSWRLQPADLAPPAETDRRLGADGFHYALRQRINGLDVTAGRVTRELQAWQWLDTELVAHETRELVANVYSPDEIVELLGDVGFVDVRVVGGYHGGEPTGDEKFLVYIARRGLTAPTTTQLS